MQENFLDTPAVIETMTDSVMRGGGQKDDVESRCAGNDHREPFGAQDEGMTSIQLRNLGREVGEVYKAKAT